MITVRTETNTSFYTKNMLMISLPLQVIKTKLTMSKRLLAKKIETGNPHVSKSKTKEYKIKQNGNKSWKE